MIASLSDRLAANPALYDLVQWLAGSKRVDAWLRQRLPRLAAGSIVLDLGGGTGAARSLLPPSCRYICLDPDRSKLRRLFERGGGAAAVAGDGRGLPFRDASLDAVLCKFVAHHLTDDGLAGMLGEVRRVLRPGGNVVLVDPLWNANRMTGRLLWRYDRGAHPRSEAGLRAALAGFSVGGCDHLRVFHEYVLLVAKRL